MELNTIGSAGNGSLTFNETEESFGRAGNFSFVSRKSENLHIWQKLFGIDGVAGRKSYHISGDRIVCLGSDYQAGSDRPMETILFQESLDPILWQGKNPAHWDPPEQAVIVDGQQFLEAFQKDWSLEEPHYVISPFGHAWVIPGGQQGHLKIDWRERETLFNYRIGLTSVTPGKRMSKGTGVIALLDQGPSRRMSSHHYFVLLNADGRSPAEFEAYTEKAAADPGYEVLRHDGTAHAVVFRNPGERPLYSYVIFEGGRNLSLPYIASANKRLNVMFRFESPTELVLSVCDTHIEIETDRSSPNYDRSRPREIRLTFAPDVSVQLTAGTSGLPQANPPLAARMENNVLRYTTANGVTDTFHFTIHDR